MRALLLVLPWIICYSAFSEVITAKVSHSKDAGKIVHIDAAPGDVINFQIEDSCEEFTPSFQGVRAALGVPTACDVICETSTIKATIPHTEEFSGYIVNVEKDDAIKIQYRNVDADPKDKFCNGLQISDLQTNPKVKPIKNTDFILIANGSPWNTYFSGGVVVSALKNPIYYVDESNMIARNWAAEDERDILFAAFTHVTHRNFAREYLGLTAGFGTGSGESLDYFVGISLKLGSAFVTAGRHWGQVDRLKNGVVIGDVVDGTRITADVVSDTNLSQKTEADTFISLSWTFGEGAEADFRSRLKAVSPDAQ